MHKARIDKDQQAAAIEHKNKIAELEEVIQQYESISRYSAYCTLPTLTLLSRNKRHSGLRLTRTRRPLPSSPRRRLPSWSKLYSSTGV
jgi:hypothetical protein